MPAEILVILSEEKDLCNLPAPQLLPHRTQLPATAHASFNHATGTLTSVLAISCIQLCSSLRIDADGKVVFNRRT
ncbi:MAG: hypothetical protein WBV55_15875 [Candidatus Sulfotelmatobacter sp.]